MTDTSTFVGDPDNGDNQVEFTAGLGFIRMYGLGGDDRLGTSINGVAYLEGGQGDDYLLVIWSSPGTTAEFYGGSGNDRIQGGASNVGDVIYGGDGDDYVEQNPNVPAGGPDYIEGGRGRDALYGRQGDDAIFGGDGRDSGSLITAGGALGGVSVKPGLYGGPGDDFLVGGRGRDYLKGGPGSDTQVGGAGNDIFDIDGSIHSPAGKQRDRILDFTKGDKIDLSDVANGLKFIGQKGFGGKAGEIRFKGEILRLDRDGDKKADIEVKLDGVSSLKEGDLLL